MDRNLREEVTNLHAQLCSAIADPNRILLLYALTNGPRNVGELQEDLDMSQSTVSHHLKTLRERGLVISERQGQFVVYHLRDNRVIEALDTLRSLMTDILREKAALANTFGTES